MSDDLQAVNPRARLFRVILSVYGIGIYIFLFAPIAVLILLSFNSSTVVGFPMAGFTTDWYARLVHDNVILGALEKSLIVAFWVTVLSTVIGTMAAFPLVRANIKNRGGVRVFITLPIMMPGLLIGVAILVLATNVLHIQPSIQTAIIGQTVLATPFVILVVSSRLEALDRNLERAAADLGANGAQRILFVVLPLIYPGIIAGGLIALTLSLDEFIVTNFIIGADQTLPIYIYNQLKFGITPEVNALATLMLLGTLAVAGVTFGALRLVKALASVRGRASGGSEVPKPHRPTGGLGGAVVEGIKAASSDACLVMDGDLQHPPEKIPEMLETLRRGDVDVVVASRYIGDGTATGSRTARRVLVSRASTPVTRAMFPVRLKEVSDPMTGFFLIDRRASTSTTSSRGVSRSCSRSWRARPLRVAEVPFHFADRHAGESKASFAPGPALPHPARRAPLRQDVALRRHRRTGRDREHRHRLGAHPHGRRLHRRRGDRLRSHDHRRTSS